MPNNLKIEYINIDEIKTYPNNAKLHPAEQIEQIKESIKEFGFNDPLALDENNMIIEGHGRLIACKELGINEVPIIRLEGLSDEQKRAYMLVHNKLTMNSDFDIELLVSELDNIADIDMSKFDFEIDLGTDEDTEIIEDEVPEVKQETKTKLGDIYQLGNHRVMCGDSTDEAQVNNLLGGEHFELTFTDPPYELETKGGGILKNANSMKQIRENGVDKFEPEKLKPISETNIYCHNKTLIKKYIELAENNKMPCDLCFYKKTNVAPNYKGHLMTDCEYIAIIGKQDPNKRP